MWGRAGERRNRHEAAMHAMTHTHEPRTLGGLDGIAPCAAGSDLPRCIYV